jgi:gentisate 1,2-dioxygenase
MNDQPVFVQVGKQPRAQRLWPCVVVPKARIDAEIERLASLPSDSTRAASINHPMNRGPVPAFTPATDVTLVVLKPGEESPPIARNSTAIDICIAGSAIGTVGNKQRRVNKFDVWNTPAMLPFSYRNDGKELFARLSYSNAPLLEFMEVHHVDLEPPAITEHADGGTASGPRARDAAVPIDIGTEGAQLRGYEWLVDIDSISSKALHWPWKEVEKYLGRVYEMDLNYTGRHLYLLYNPATERRMGTSAFHFATMAKFPPKKIDRPHRHTSASINYYLWGHGRSTVNGERVEWEAGDLQFSAPGWVIHNHASREQGFVALTVQDHPLHIAMDSLLWQEELKGPIQHLGVEHGFNTNLSAVAGE